MNPYPSGLGEEEPAHVLDKYDQEIEQLYLEHGAQLQGHVMKKGVSVHLAEDIVQDSFMATRSRWGVVRTYDRPIAYVYRVAKNRLVRLSQGRAEPHPDPYDVCRSNTYVAQPNLELRLLIDEAINTLPPQVARVARLHYLADLKVTVVARRMGISESTVKGYLSVARRQLRQRLAGWEDEQWT